MGCRWVDPAQRQPSLLLSSESKKCLERFFGYTNGSIRFQNRRRNKTCCLLAVHHQFINGTESALCSLLLTSVPTPRCRCEPFPCKPCPGIFFVRGAKTKVVGILRKKLARFAFAKVLLRQGVTSHMKMVLRRRTPIFDLPTVRNRSGPQTFKHPFPNARMPHLMIN